MKARDLFGIIVRVLGLLSIGYGLQCVLSWVFMTLKHDSPTQVRWWGAIDYLIIGLVYTPLGLFLLRGASRVVNFAYPEDRNEEANHCAKREDVA